MRIDLFLFKNDYVKSRQKAKTLVEEGNVKVDGEVIKKPSYDIDECSKHLVEIFDDCPYVSRGGLKLESIIKHLNYDINGKVCVDIGASTGGFTHCLLLNGAKKVFAVDSGSNQLATELLEDPRVVSIEGYNARNISVDDIGTLADVITMDVSFISQTLIIPAASQLLNENGVFFCLIKPQFEVGRSNVGKGGIVKSAKARLEAVRSVIGCANSFGLKCIALIVSPIQGGDGNIEFLAAFAQNGIEIKDDYIRKIVL